MQVKIERLKKHDDNRGIEFKPIEDGSIKSKQNCHVVTSKPGTIRGNQYHLSGTETLAVMGPALVIFKEGK